MRSTCLVDKENYRVLPYLYHYFFQCEMRGIIRLTNNTKVKYIKVQDKLYKVTNISFFHMTVDTIETDLTVNDVSEDEIFDYEIFKDYKIKLVNESSGAEVVDFGEWKIRNKRV